MPEYLMRPKGSRNWVVRVAVPRRLWSVIGRKEYQRTTGTSDRRVAEKLRYKIIREIRREIATLADRDLVSPLWHKRQITGLRNAARRGELDSGVARYLIDTLSNQYGKAAGKPDDPVAAERTEDGKVGDPAGDFSVSGASRRSRSYPLRLDGGRMPHRRRGDPRNDDPHAQVLTTAPPPCRRALSGMESTHKFEHRAPITVWLRVQQRESRRKFVEEFSDDPEFLVADTPCRSCDDLATCIVAFKPNVVVVEYRLLRQFVGRLHRIGADPLDSHILALVKEPGKKVARKILLQRCFGFLDARGPSINWRKAVRAVARSEVWLPRRQLTEALWELLGPIYAEGAPPRCAETGTIAKLTTREVEVAQLVRLGFTNKEIALRLSVEEDTIKKHLTHIYKKLGVRRRTAMAARLENSRSGHVSKT